MFIKESLATRLQLLVWTRFWWSERGLHCNSSINGYHLKECES